VALIESIIDRRKPTFKLVISLFAGFLGLFILSLPTIKQGSQADILAIIALLFAPLSWGCGSILLVRRPVGISPQASAGYQQLVGCIGFFIISLLLKEPSIAPVKEAWFAWGYLVIAGGVCAFTAYMYALKLLPTALVATYAYVNPVIAVILGWLILKERITGWTVIGAILILLGVFGVFRAKAAIKSA
jgi:drug/metabolite transporter (DMT)-like permease